MGLKEIEFKSANAMTQEMEKFASAYEGYVPGRIGYNFPNDDGSYTIAYIKGDYATKMHELRHARYYLDSQYRNEVNKIWSLLDNDTKRTIERFLKRCGYSESVLIDEFQAYAFTEKDPEKFFGLKKGSLKDHGMMSKIPPRMHKTRTKKHQ
jgi:hypothetical protein